MLLTLMAVTAVVVGGITLIVLYQVAFRSQSARLHEIAQSQARMIEAFNRQHLTQQPHLGESDMINAIVSLLREAHNKFQGFGRTGEYTFAMLQDNTIVFLLSARTHKTQTIGPIAMDSELAAPMRQALLGHSGVMLGLDYRGKQVLAAYEPVGVFHMGIVAKIDLGEFQAPFIKAGLLAAGVSAILLLITGLLFRRISTGMVESAEQSKSKLNVILNTVVDGIISIDEHSTITSFNSAAESIFGYTAAQAIGQHINLLIPHNLHQRHDAYLRDYIQNDTGKVLGISREVIGLRKDGSTFPVELAVGNARLGKQMYFTAIVRDITKRKKNEQELQLYRNHLEQQVEQRTIALQKANEKLQKLARRDSLTGIANRRVFDEVLTREVRRAAREQTPLTLVLCDIDFFKAYNDSYGHLAGDSCLTKVARATRQHFHRAGDLVSRFGGEEFAIVLPNTGSQEAAHMSEVLRQAIWDLNIPHRSSTITDRITISIGLITVVPRNNLISKTIIKAADDALYQAKEHGRNRVVVSTVSDTRELTAAQNA